MSIIQLGAPGALRKYLVKARGDGLLWGRGPAQPFSAKVNSSSKYDQIDIWNEWVQEDWQAGVGQIDPEAGGFLFSTLETRVPGQIILAQAIRAHRHAVTPAVTSGLEIAHSPDQASAFTTVTVGTGGYAKLAWKVDYNEGNVGKPPVVWVERATGSPTIQMACYIDSGGSPSVPNTAGTATIPSGTMGCWPLAITGMGFDDLVANYWYVIWTDTASSSFLVHCATTRTGSPVTKSYDGAVWTSRTVYPFFYGEYAGSGHSYPIVTDEKAVFIAGITGGTNVFSEVYDSTGDEIDTAATALAATTLNGPPAYVFDFIYIPTTAGLYWVTSAGATFTNTGLAATKVAGGGGYLWRANGQTLYYWNGTADPWVTVGDVGTAPWVVKSMAMLERDLYVATGDGLFRIAPGDLVEAITPWGNPHTDNGQYLLNYQNNLYVIVNGRVLQFTADGQVSDIWIKKDDGLPASRIGNVVALGKGLNALYALVASASTTGCPTVWVWQEEGWHFIAQIPSGALAPSAVVYDRDNARLWIGLKQQNLFDVYESGYAQNPYNDANSRYMPNGWIEWDRFYGGQLLIDKDWESVTVIGENLSANVNVKVYWKDEDSTDWELLGTATADGQELRWSTYSTRPAGKWIKLGLLLQTNSASATARIRAVSVKFLPMVNDRIRDTLNLTLSDYITFPDNTQDTYTRAQQWTHLLSMIQRVPPLIYQDPFGSQYEVKVTDWSTNAVTYNTDTGTAVVREQEVTLVLEQTPDTVYV